MSYRITISGYYGFGNIGDEAVLAGIIETFRRLSIPVRFTVLSGNPSYTLIQHPGVSAANRFSVGEVFKAIRNSDLVLSGGGSLIQDVTSAMSPYYYLFVLHLARILRRKTMVYAQGIGPLIRESTKRAVARAFNRTDVITVRDPDSKTFLENIGVTKPIALSADPSFLLVPDVRSADRLLAEHGLNGENLLGISLRPWPGRDRWLPVIAEGVRVAAGKLGLTCLSVPMHPGRDAQLLRKYPEVRELIVEKSEIAKGLFARCNIVVGMRLHSLMFAAGAGVPFVPLVYDPKVQSFAKMSGVDLALHIEDLSPNLIKRSILDAWSMRSCLGADLARRASVYAELALDTGRLAQRLLAGEVEQ